MRIPVSEFKSLPKQDLSSLSKADIRDTFLEARFQALTKIRIFLDVKTVFTRHDSGLRLQQSEPSK